MHFDSFAAQAGLFQRAIFGQMATLTLHDHGQASEQAMLALVRELAARGPSLRHAERAGCRLRPGLMAHWGRSCNMRHLASQLTFPSKSSCPLFRPRIKLSGFPLKK